MDLSGDSTATLLVSGLAVDIVEHLPSAILVVGTDGRTLYANAAANALVGPLDPGEAILPRLAPNDDLRECVGAALLAHTGAPVTELGLRGAGGETIPVEVRTLPLRGETESADALLFLVENVSAARRRENEIRRLERLAALGRFASSIAHEIRNPLAGIGAGVQYLQKFASLGNDEQNTVRLVLDEVKRLDRIVEDIFLAGRPLRLRIEPTDILGPIERAITLAADFASGLRVEVAVEHDTSLPEIPVDAERIEQVILNLLKNAVQASPPGARVVVRTRLAIESAHERLVPGGGGPVLAVEIVDAGVGIATDQINRIFEPFYSLRHGGTGLGLYVSHLIAEAHGGAIQATSEPGKGSLFALLLPYDRESEGHSSCKAAS